MTEPLFSGGTLNMAENYLVQEETASGSPARFEKPFSVFIVIALLCLCGKLIWLVGVAPFRPFTRIDIYGYSETGRDIVFGKAGITPTLSYFTADVSTMEKALMSLGVFESARVFKYFPARLQIVLEDRKAVAQALASINGRTVPVLLDREGVIFGIGDYSALRSEMLPVISGIVIEEPFPGMRLPVLFSSLFLNLEKISNSTPELLEAVSELRVSRKLFDGYDLILYPAHSRIKVLLSELNENQLRYSLLMVDVLSTNNDIIDTLDFRSGIASYVPKEAPSE